MGVEQPLAIDCFAGAGGLSLGLKRAGFRVGAAFDFDERAVDTYRHNLGDHVVRVDATEIGAEALLQIAGAAPGQVKLVAGGPPCQGFSRQRRGEDTDQRNDLVLEFARIVLELRPE